MNYRILSAPDADLDDLAASLARVASLETSLRFYDAAARTFEAIARTPELGERGAGLADRTSPKIPRGMALRSPPYLSATGRRLTRKPLPHIDLR